MLDIKATQNDLQMSLKCIEVVLCSEDGTRVRECTPRSGDTVKLEVYENKSTPSTEPSNVHTKRKYETPQSIGLHLNQVLTISDDDSQNAAKKACQSLPPIKMDGGMATCKPKLPYAWTHPQMNIEVEPTGTAYQSEFKRNVLTQV